MSCAIEDMTVDAAIYGHIIEVEKFNGEKELIAGRFREPHPEQIYCSNCGSYVNVEFDDIDAAVREHIKESENALSH
jgi:hypothetical protein